MEHYTLVQHADSRDSTFGRIAAIERAVCYVVLVSVKAHFDNSKWQRSADEDITSDGRNVSSTFHSSGLLSGQRKSLLGRKNKYYALLRSWKVEARQTTNSPAPKCQPRNRTLGANEWVHILRVVDLSGSRES